MSNKLLNKKELDMLKSKYPVGTLVELISICDRWKSISPGSIGRIVCVDDVGQLHVLWQDGSQFALVPGLDSFNIIG